MFRLTFKWYDVCIIWCILFCCEIQMMLIFKSVLRKKHPSLPPAGATLLPFLCWFAFECVAEGERENGRRDGETKRHCLLIVPEKIRQLRCVLPAGVMTHSCAHTHTKLHRCLLWWNSHLRGLSALWLCVCVCVCFSVTDWDNAGGRTDYVLIFFFLRRAGCSVVCVCVI